MPFAISFTDIRAARRKLTSVQTLYLQICSISAENHLGKPFRRLYLEAEEEKSTPSSSSGYKNTKFCSLLYLEACHRNVSSKPGNQDANHGVLL